MKMFAIDWVPINRVPGNGSFNLRNICIGLRSLQLFSGCLALSVSAHRLELLIEITNTHCQTIWVIDALDECHDPYEILDQLDMIQTKHQVA